MSGNNAIVLSEKELVGLYVRLKPRENDLDLILLNLLSRMEKILYQTMTIEEIETIQDIYGKGFDFNPFKG
jgi:hypothetical protein